MPRPKKKKGGEGSSSLSPSPESSPPPSPKSPKRLLVSSPESSSNGNSSSSGECGSTSLSLSHDVGVDVVGNVVGCVREDLIGSNCDGNDDPCNAHKVFDEKPKSSDSYPNDPKL